MAPAPCSTSTTLASHRSSAPRCAAPPRCVARWNSAAVTAPATVRPQTLSATSVGSSIGSRPSTREQIADSTRRLDDVVVRRVVGAGRVRWESGRLAEHDVGSHGHDVVVGETQPRDRARPQVRDHDVGHRGDPQERCASRVLFEIEHDAALVPHQVHRHARQLGVRAGSHEAVRVTDRGLDGDDLGAEITERLGRDGPITTVLRSSTRTPSSGRTPRRAGARRRSPRSR